MNSRIGIVNAQIGVVNAVSACRPASLFTIADPAVHDADLGSSDRRCPAACPSSRRTPSLQHPLLAQDLSDVLHGHARMLEYFGGVSAAIVPDQLKSGVARSCWYDPKIQRTYEAMAEHYGTTVMPARPGKPRDKAKVEVAVQVVQRWILARLRTPSGTPRSRAASFPG